MAIIAKYKFNPSLYADYLPTFNKEFTGYIKTDVTNSDGTITRTISHDTLKPTTMRFGINGEVTDREKSLLEVIECDTSNMTGMFAMFQGCSSLTSLNTSNFNTDNITNISSMFSGCSELTSLNLSSFNTSKVTNMNSMFNTCNKLISLDLSSFNTSQVTNMSYMFFNCSSLTSLDLSNFNTSKVTSMNNMFSNCSSLTSLDLSNWNANRDTSMSWVFGSCSVPNIGLLYATSSTINRLLTHLGTDVARNIYYTDAALSELTVQDNITYIKYELTKATLPYTLNKLPNDVADYIDVVNKVHVQRVGVIKDASTLNWGTWSDNPNADGNARFVGGIPINSLPDGATINNATFMSDKLIPLSSMNTNLALYSVSNFVLVTFLGLENNTLDGFKAKMTELKPTILYPLATPIYTPLTEEEIAQLPLSAYKDGYINLSSDQLMPSFEFRMKASNRYQVDMLETGYYYLNTPVGNVKLGTANVDVQQMPCIIKVDNVGTGDSTYRLSTSVTSSVENIEFLVSDTIDGGYYSPTDGHFVENNNMYYSPTYYNIEPNTNYGINAGSNTRITLYDESQNFIRTVEINNTYGAFITPSNVKYCRFSSNKYTKKDYTLIANPITLAKLPSHRIPTSFTQGMKCGTDFGYWEGVRCATGKQLYVNETNKLDFAPIELNRIEYGNTIVEDEFDIATGKLTKRVGIMTLDGSENWVQVKDINTENDKYVNTFGLKFNDMVKQNFKSQKGTISNRYPYQASIWQLDKEGLSVGGTDIILALYKEKTYSLEVFKQYLANSPLTFYYELQVPEISYVSLPSNQVKTVANSTLLQSWRANTTYLNPQVKPSHLTYPVPSLVGNRTYTVVHNRKNITGSTKPIELNLGGTVVQLNDASSKTLVKTPSTLAHSNLIFIGGESTVDHIMVLDGDWTNKPIEYFENMMGHDTDAIITIIGNGQINDVEEQYLW